MLALLALGALEKTDAFPGDDVSPDLLKRVVIENDYQTACYRELIATLQQRGRRDLVRVLKRAIALYHLKRVVKRLDAKLSGGKLAAWTKRRWKRKHNRSRLPGRSKIEPPTGLADGR